MSKKKGLHVTGIELSEDMAQQAREKGIECYVNDCSDFNLDDKFDAVNKRELELGAATMASLMYLFDINTIK